MQGRETGKSRKRRERQGRSKGVICANRLRAERGIARFVRQSLFAREGGGTRRPETQTKYAIWGRERLRDVLNSNPGTNVWGGSQAGDRLRGANGPRLKNLLAQLHGDCRDLASARSTS